MDGIPRSDALAVGAALRRARLAERGARALAPEGPEDARLAPALAQTLLDLTYGRHAEELWRGRRLAVTWTAYHDGRGDAMTAVKVAAILARHAPLDVWMPRGMDAADLFGFLPRAAILTYSERLRTSRPAPDLVVWVNPKDRSRPRLEIRGDEARALYVVEHDFLEAPPSGSVLLTGFGPASAGFFTAPLPFGRLSEAVPRSEATRPAARAAVWTALGVAAPSGDLSRAPPSLHTCYPHAAPMATVVDACLAFAGSDARALDVVYVAKSFHSALAQAQRLAAAGRLSSFELWRCDAAPASRLVIAPQAAGVQAAPPSPPPFGRRLLLSPAGAPKTFSLCLRCSDFAVVTGDQSLSEAIALGLPFAFDAPLHKVRSSRCLASLVPLSLGDIGRQAFGPDLSASAAAWRHPGVASALRAHLAELTSTLDVAPRLLGRCLQALAPEGHPAPALGRLLAAARTPGAGGAATALEAVVADLGREIAALGAVGASTPGRAPESPPSPGRPPSRLRPPRAWPGPRPPPVGAGGACLPSSGAPCGSPTEP